MAITPRKSEIEQVAALVDSGDYDDAHQLASACIKTVAELVQARDGKEGVGLSMVMLQGAPIGPFYTEAEAERWATRAKTELGLEGRVLRLWTPTTYTLADKHDIRAARCGCGHPKEMHLERKKGNKIQYAKCGVWHRAQAAWCGCSNFEKETL